MIGPSAYKLIHANMPEAFPSLSTVEREASKRYHPLKEGEFLFDKLAAHLDAYNAPRMISISEDATRVVSRVEYDGNSDSIVGFVLPISEDSLPKQNLFSATTLEEIEQIFASSKKATSAYIYVAQAISLNVPPFCLALIGSDNCFDATVVLKRWEYIIKECNARNIKVISFGSDGDSKLLTSMRVSIKLDDYAPKQYQKVNLITQDMLSHNQGFGIPQSWNSWFSAKNVASITFVQDPVHLGVKLKARLLTYSQILPMGKYAALSSHLSLLQASFGKEQHNLRTKDLDHQDRQNFEAVLRITSENVISLLDDIPDSKGTKYYLQVTKCILESYLNKEFDPITRVTEAWYALFFVRFWRKWLLCHEDYTLESNFISLNSYLCIEINAHALIIFVLMLRKYGKSMYCLPWLLGSQPCEKAFRAARSMSPTFSTMINFTVLGLIRRLHKLQIQVDLESISEATGIIYPHKVAHDKKSGMNKDTMYTCENITNKNIEDAIKFSLQKAKAAMEDLGMKELLVKGKKWDDVYGDSKDDVIKKDVDDDDDLKVADEYVPMISELDNQECKEITENIAQLEEKKIIDKSIKQKATYLCQREIADTDGRTFIPMYKKMDMKSSVDKKHGLRHKYIEIEYKGENIYVRKSTIVWLLQESERVSSDRLFRVRVKQPYSTLEKQIPSKSLKEINYALPQVKDQVELGDLCVFSEERNGWKVGRIMQFAKHKEKLKSNRQYKPTIAPVTSDSIGVLCSWFRKLDNKFSISSSTNTVDYISLTRYICSLSLGCLQNTKHSSNTETYLNQVRPISALYTASEFTLAKEVIETIDLHMAEMAIKQHPSVTMPSKQNDKALSQVIDLTGADNSELVLDVERLWMICCGFRLTMKE